MTLIYVEEIYEEENIKVFDTVNIELQILVDVCIQEIISKCDKKKNTHFFINPARKIMFP